MVEVLFGNKTVQKILIFLFVNGKCYGTQLHKLLKTPLTPIQKSLLRLEKGGLILSYYEGKTRLYHFNPAFPLLDELKILLKKAYTLMPAGEKRSYYVAPESPNLLSPSKVVFALWKRLNSLHHLTFHAKTKSQSESIESKCDVHIVKEDNALVFHEKGIHKNRQGEEIAFSNVFRWTLDKEAGLISLEHLRHGLKSPVFLFHLSPTGNHSLASVESHECGQDSYFGQIFFDQKKVHLNIRVIGPKKNEEIDYYYS